MQRSHVKPAWFRTWTISGDSCSVPGPCNRRWKLRPEGDGKGFKERTAAWSRHLERSSSTSRADFPAGCNGQLPAERPASRAEELLLLATGAGNALGLPSAVVVGL